MSAAKGKTQNSDRKMLLILAATMIAILVGASLLAKSTEDDDSRPSIYNTGTAGAKAAFLMLQELGYSVGHWDKPLSALGSVPAERTTLVLADPKEVMAHRKQEAADLQRFLERGGRVLLTGDMWASLLPGGEVGAPAPLTGGKLCYTTPEGLGPLAAAGEVETLDSGNWTAQGPQFRVEQRCGKDAVVVRFPVGKGEAVWWSSSMPLSNAGLKRDSGLKLLLGSLYGRDGRQRDVLFDEYLQEYHYDNDTGPPLPWHALVWQLVAVFALLVWSFSRRNGPLRMPVELPRSSPVEFATSMGDLYEKAAATGAATDAARRRLLRTVQLEAGVGRAAVEEGPDAIAEALSVRLRDEWSGVAQHLREADAAAREPVNGRSALTLVRALREDEERVREALLPEVAPNVVEGELAEAVKE